MPTPRRTGSRPRAPSPWNPSWLDALASRQERGYHGLYDVLVDVIETLTPKQQEVVNAIFWERVTQPALADRLGINQSNVSRRLSRAMAVIRKALEDGGNAP